MAEQGTDPKEKIITQWLVMLVISIAMAICHLYFATLGFITEMS